MWVFGITVIVIGLLCIILGLVIRKKNMVEIIAGYDPNKVTDKKGLANWVGTNLMFIGVFSIIFGLITTLTPGTGTTRVIIYVVGLFLLTIRMAIGTNKYER